jgi:hypothetical protein
VQPDLQQLDLEAVLAHVPTPLVVLQIATGATLYANRAARRMPFAYREIEGWSAVDEHGQVLAGPDLPHHAASRGDCFEGRVVHFASETGRYSLKFHCHGLGGDTCVLAFEDVTASVAPSVRSDRPDLAEAEIAELANTRCPSLVVENLLDANRIRVGTFALDITHGALADVIVEVRALLGEQAAAMTTQINDRGDGDWDAARMARVIANLVLEAIEHGGGEISTRIARLGNDVELRIECPRAATSTRQTLGMFVVKEIVAAHRGSFDVQPGLYRILLPVTQ